MGGLYFLWALGWVLRAVPVVGLIALGYWVITDDLSWAEWALASLCGIVLVPTTLAAIKSTVDDLS